MLHVISDLHLAPAAAEDGIWRRYLTRRYFPDDRVAALFRRIAAGGAAHEVILAGDLFDLDLVAGAIAEPAGRAVSRWSGADRSEAAAVRRLEAVLDDHPVFIRALAGLIVAGVRVTILLGNHDTELEWPAARAALARRLEATAGEPIGDRFAIEPWCVYRPGLCFVTHGHHSDPFNRPVDVRTGLASGGKRARLPFAAICQRALTNHMDSFNSTVEASFIRDAASYSAHWWRYHAFTGRNLISSWIAGALVAFRNVLRQEWREGGPPGPAALEAHARARGLPAGSGALFAEIWPAPAIRDLRTILRELWIDRLAAVATGLVAVAILLVCGAGPLLATAGPFLGAALTMGVVGVVAGRSAVAGYEGRLPAAAARISRHLCVPFVVLGHTHKARVVPFEGAGGAYLNTGAWSPGFLDPECTRPAHERFTFVEIDPAARLARLRREDDSGPTTLAAAS